MRSRKILSVLVAAALVSGNCVLADEGGVRNGGKSMGVGCCCCPCDTIELVDTCNYGVMFGTCGPVTRKLCLCGLIQTDYQLVETVDRGEGGGSRVDDPWRTNNFLMRRVRLGFDADLGNSWRGVVTLNFRGCNEESADSNVLIGEVEGISPSSTSYGVTHRNTRNLDGIFGIHNAFIQKTYAGSTFRFGYKKVNFGREENIHAAELKTIERSPLTEFFNGPQVGGVTTGSPLGFGRRHVGIFVDGQYCNFGYGAALVNGYQGTCIKSNKDNNRLGGFANLYYFGNFNNIDVQLGGNVGYKGKGNDAIMAANGTRNVLDYNNASIFGWNAYLMAHWKGWSLLAEALGAKIEKGAIDGRTDSKPSGFTVMPSYLYNEHWEFVVRFSALDTDFHGTRIDTIIPGAQGVLIGANKAGGGLNRFGKFDKVNSWYAGINYYLMNRAVKVMLGYERNEFKHRAIYLSIRGDDTVDGGDFVLSKAIVQALRARVQVVF